MFAACRNRLGGGDSDCETPVNNDRVINEADPKVLGVCFMGGDACMSTYVDLGPYEGPELDKAANLIPVYMFPADFKSGKIRDLFVSPVKGEAELLDMVELGQIRLENTYRNTDCPMFAPEPGDHVINLNPGFRICQQ